MKFFKSILLLLTLSLSSMLSAQGFNTSSPQSLYLVDAKAIAAADVNGDGHTDIGVGTYNYDSDLYLFYNFGNAQYNSIADTWYSKVPEYPKNLVAADLNANGRNELMTADYSDSSISIYFHDNLWDVDSVHTIALGQYRGVDIAAGYIDADSILDLAVITQDNSRLQVYFGRGDGTFTNFAEYTTSGNPWDVKIVDIDNDLDNDILVGNGGGSTFKIHYNDGTGSFPQSTSIASYHPPSYIDTADLNGDAFPDVICGSGSYDVGTLIILLNDQAGGFSQSAVVDAGSYLRGLRVGHFDADSFEDFATLDNNGLYISHGDGAGGVTGTDTLVAYSGKDIRDIEVADLNGDQRQDIMVCERNEVFIYFADGNTSALQDAGKMPLTTQLEQNYPNPFNPVTTITYRLGATTQVELTVLNALGQKVQTLINRNQEAGAYTVSFNGIGLASGIYYCRLRTGTTTQMRKMVLLK